MIMQDPRPSGEQPDLVPPMDDTDIPATRPEDADLFDDQADLVPLDQEQEEADDVIGEDDDNPYEESDEALPDDREERSINRDISREGSRFGEI